MSKRFLRDLHFEIHSRPMEDLVAKGADVEARLTKVNALFKQMEALERKMALEMRDLFDAAFRLDEAARCVSVCPTHVVSGCATEHEHRTACGRYADSSKRLTARITDGPRHRRALVDYMEKLRRSVAKNGMNHMAPAVHDAIPTPPTFETEMETD